jgi:hypothetical protein
MRKEGLGHQSFLFLPLLTFSKVKNSPRLYFVYLQAKQSNLKKEKK